MDNETAQYLIKYFPQLLTKKEKLAIRHQRYSFKLSVSSNATSRAKRFKERGLLTDDVTVLDILKDGYETFELNTGKRILSESGDKVFLNNCPSCGRLARTPQARQCRHCGHDWHHIIAASFKLNACFQVTNRPYFLVGVIVKGEVKIGNYLDLTFLGLNRKPKIIAIEFVQRVTEGAPTNDIALGTNDLSIEEKEYLSDLRNFGHLLEITSIK